MFFQSLSHTIQLTDYSSIVFVLPIKKLKRYFFNLNLYFFFKNTIYSTLYILIIYIYYIYYMITQIAVSPFADHRRHTSSKDRL